MIGEKLIKLRKIKGYSQQDVADMLDVTRQTISNWECNQGAPTLDKAKQLSELYQVSLDDLVGNENMFITKQKEISPLLLSLLNKTCIIDSEVFDFDGYNNGEKVKIVEINDEWINIEYERTKENSFLKKETVCKFIEVSCINAFQIVEEDM